jgi:beta-glucosidase
MTAGVDAWSAGALVFSDGPNGVRGPGFDERDSALCTPCGSALAATWDPALVRAVGGLIGHEARRKAVQVVLGPVLNIPRSPLGGRCFECLGEDPLLSGTLAAAWIAGVQAAGVAACPKHFVCNDSETARTRLDCVVSERALREIYLVPFEHALRAGAWALMAAYNAVNGTPCTEHGELLRGVVKGEWGWDGVVISDWYAARRTVACAAGGLDLEMPGPPRAFGAALAEAVDSGAVDGALLDDKVERLERLAARVGGEPPAPPPADLLREAAAAGFVLLKNDGALLPLDRARRIAVIGPAATDPCLQGGGSAQIAVATFTDPLTAIRARFGQVTHERGCSQRPGAGPLHALTGPLLVEYLAGGETVARERRATSRLVWLGTMPDGADRVRVSGMLEPPCDGVHGVSVRGSGPVRLAVGGTEVARHEPPADVEPLAALFSDVEGTGEIALGAGEPVPVRIELTLPPRADHVLAFGCRPPEPADAIERAVAAAVAADVAVVLVGTSDDVEAESADRATTALPGRQDELVPRVIAANANTVVVVNAGAAVDMPWADDAPAVLYAWFGGHELGPALADVLAGDREPGGRLALSIAHDPGDYAAYDTAPDADGRLQYREGVLVGYRQLDAAGAEPRFCFGHGLGYTEFAYERLRVAPGEAAVTVRNAGDRAGKEVVQLYVSGPEDSVPPLELRAFAAVTLAPGESRTVVLELGERAFAHWDEARSDWHAEPGKYGIHVGRSSRELRLHDIFTIS